ncbi:MAG: hypothetical protein ACPGIC_00285 [Opitutales bacterium]
MTPEKLHLALNHIPLIGMGFAIIPLLFGLISKSRPALLSGFMIATVAGWATPFIMGAGEQAYERYKHGEIRKQLDPGAVAALEIHEEIGHSWSKLLYTTAVVASIGLVAAIYQPRSCKPLAWLLLLMCIASVIAAVQIADSGGKIRRPDFRQLK